eukprot:3428105-Prymnesium_polylepis.1
MSPLYAARTVASAATINLSGLLPVGSPEHALFTPVGRTRPDCSAPAPEFTRLNKSRSRRQEAGG